MMEWHLHYMCSRTILSFVAALICLSLPAAADDKAAHSLANDMAGKTYRIDEGLIRTRREIWHHPQFVFFGRDGIAHVWYPGKNTVYAAHWRVRERKVRIRQDTEGTYVATLDKCVVTVPLSTEGQVECETETFETQRNENVSQSRLRFA